MLTDREREVLEEIITGKPFALIGKELGLTRQRIYQVKDSLTKKGIINKSTIRMTEHGEKLYELTK